MINDAIAVPRVRAAALERIRLGREPVDSGELILRIVECVTAEAQEKAHPSR
jgi:hypothetical protein